MSKARAYVRARAAESMTSTCVITRPVDPSFAAATGLATGSEGDEVYSGICRVWEVTGGGVVVVGEDEIAQQTTNISSPWDSSPVPIKGDYIKIATSLTDTNLVGRLFMITDQAKSGELRATRRFSVMEVQEKVDGRNH